MSLFTSTTKTKKTIQPIALTTFKDCAKFRLPITPVLHRSIIPRLQHYITPGKLTLPRRRSQHFTRIRAGRRAVFNDDFAVDDCVWHSNSLLDHPCFVAGQILHVLWLQCVHGSGIEDGDVGRQAGPEQAAIAETENRCDAES